MDLKRIFAICVLASALASCQTGKAIDSVASNTQASSETNQSKQTNVPAIAPIIPSAANQSASLNDPQILPAETTIQARPLQTPIPSPSPKPFQVEQANASVQPSVSQSSNIENNSNLVALRSPDALSESLSEQASVPVIQRPRTQKTYLINGLLSAVPFIGYGFRNLHKKMPEAQLFSYISPVESSTVILPRVLREIEQAYTKDPNVSVNLIGISLGADFITIVAERLNKKNIPVNYLGIVDGTNLRPITANVVKADNLTCTFLDCTRAKARLARGNRKTIFKQKKYRSSHIPLGNNDQLHAHVIAQSRS